MTDLLALARKDAQRITIAEFGVDMIIIDTESDSYCIRGLIAKNHTQIDIDTGAPVNAKNTHITISEKQLQTAGCTTRNANDEVDMVNFLVQFADSTGNISTYKVNDVIPDETLGLITLNLGDYK